MFRSYFVLIASFSAIMTFVSLQNVVFAQEQEYQPTVQSTTHVEETLPGDDSKTVIIREFTFPPGYEGGQHYHPGAVYVYVLEGELTIDVNGRGVEKVSAGQLYQEPLERTMSARNTSTTDTTRVLVYQVGETGKPMMIEVD